MQGTSYLFLLELMEKGLETMSLEAKQCMTLCVMAAFQSVFGSRYEDKAKF